MPTAVGFGAFFQQLQQTQIQVKARLAPTPSGFLHRGNLYNMILNWWLARATSGKVLLRIDDLDRERVRMPYLDFIFRCLDWLELDWDEGPSGPDDLLQNWSQEHRAPIYQNLKQRLHESGFLYPCSCTRNTLKIEACRCKINAAETGPTLCSLKLALPETLYQTRRGSSDGFILEDPVVWKKNDTAAYHLASVADDLHFNISHVVRGEDLIPATLIQQQLATMAGLQSFEHIVFMHHPLLRDASGMKLAKSAGSQSVMPELQEPPFALLRSFATWAGLPQAHEVQRLRDILHIAVDKS
jgi:glutamyl/glutaminyl-tRNA synthetase